MRLSKPQGDIRSLAWKARTKTARRLVSGSPDDYEGDDFDWSRYHLEYSQQIKQLEADHTLRLEDEQWDFRNGEIELNRGLPLHPNHKALYEAIVSLSPTSVLEAGCGGGDHLHNLAKLLPEAQIRGIDRSEGQLGVLRYRNPQFGSRTSVVDLTLPHPVAIERADVVFAQAVLMHIQTGNGHRVALANLFSLSNRYVVMMENWSRHNFLDDTYFLYDRGIISWENLYLYERSFPDLMGQPKVLVASTSPLPKANLQELGKRCRRQD